MSEEKPDLRLIHPAETAEQRKVLPDAVLGIIFFIMTETMMFGGFVSALNIAKTSVPMWPPPGQPRLPIEATAFTTAALIASGVLMYIAGRRFAKDPSAARIPMLASVALGALFVVMQGSEWVQLLSEGLSLTVSTHASFFYLIVGAHALHAIGGLIAVSVLYYRLINQQLTAEYFQAGRLFWYFVVGLWPLLYWQVYL